MTAKRQAAAGGVAFASVLLAASPAFGQTPAQCAGSSEWAAEHREWMTDEDAWCAVEVGFRYAGSSGDIKLAIKRQPAAHAMLADLASVDLPANGGQTSAFQFIFPCAEKRAQALCVVYEAAPDALMLDYDYLDLGVGTRVVPRALPVQRLVPLVPALLTLAPSPHESLSATREARRSLMAAIAADGAPSDFAAGLRVRFEPVETVDAQGPVAVPIDRLRRRGW